MTPQTFSLEMCRHLSSLVPGFEGHWVYAKSQCPRQPDDEQMRIFCFNESYCKDEIIPAWQVEDVLRNLEFIIDRKIYLENEQKLRGLLPGITQKISSLLVRHPDTAYQKIEEYLWIILK